MGIVQNRDILFSTFHLKEELSDLGKHVIGIWGQHKDRGNSIVWDQNTISDHHALPQDGLRTASRVQTRTSS